ncbi:MAG: ABC transporter ATP-binding protein [Acutalibacter sp.]|jgi:ATP-binding cassette subfamily B protein AbcA/BmrA
MKKRPFDTFRTVLSGVKIPWILALISMVSSFLMANAMIGTAVITANVVDSSGNLRTEDLVQYIVLLLGSGLLASLGSFCNNVLSEKINIGVRSKLWKKMLRLPMRYYDSESGENLVSRITVDCNRASAFIGVVISTVVSLYSLYLAVSSMLSFSTTLTLWSACLVPVVALGVALSGKLVFRMQNRLYQTQADTTAYLLERVKNLRLVRTSNMVEEETAQGTGRFQSMFRASVGAMLSDQLMASFIAVTPVALIVITFLVGSVLVAQNKISLGEVIGFYTVSAMASIRINALITAYGDLVSANGVFHKISRVLQAEKEPQEGIPLDLPDESITLDQVDFSYGEKKIFDQLSCVIPAHRVTAIIGDNGAGKSTLFKLLDRIYEPDGGELRFGQRNAQTFQPVSWRSAFALVSQDRPLISGTIRENITYGCTRQVSEEELEQVARQAGIWELVCSLPQGFDTRVEANGGNFSGGQRQCIAIARAIMRNPDYLLLDEATSNLDAQSERQVSQALANLMAGRTTVMIAHSVSAISHADYIIVLKDGKVEASGTPEEVSATSSVFRNFIQSQYTPQEV